MSLIHFFITVFISVRFMEAVNYVDLWKNRPDIGVKYYLNNERKSKYTPTVNLDKLEDCIYGEYKPFAEANPHSLDVARAMEAFGNCFCTDAFDIKYKCHYVTIDYLKHEELKKAKYYDLRVKIVQGVPRYFNEMNAPAKLDTLVSKIVTNRGSQEAKTTIQQTIKKDDSITTTLTSGISVDAEIKAEVDLIVASFSQSISIGYEYTYSSATTEGTGNTFVLSDAVPIAPRSSKKITWTVNKVDFGIRWEIPVLINGSLAIKMNYENENDLVFIPVTQLVPFFTDFTLSDEPIPRLQVTVRGVTTGKRNFEGSVITKDLSVEDEVAKVTPCDPLPKSS